MPVDNPFAVGIDVGATHTKLGLVRAPAEFVDHQILPTRLAGSDPGPYMASLYQVMDGYAQRHALAGIGVSLCSLINADHSGALLSVNAPALNQFDIRQALVDRYACPVKVENDVVAYALAEYHLGAGQGVQRLLCLALGTGLAIACISGGRTLETWAGVPADAARIILRPDAAEACNGGVHGSAEALCGTAQIERLARTAYGRSAVRAREVIEAARAGEEPAAQILSSIGRDVAHLLAILSPVFFPQRIVITGGTAEAGAPFFDALRARYAHLIGAYMDYLAHLDNPSAQPLEIVKGQLGPEAAVLGSALGFLQPISS